MRLANFSKLSKKLNLNPVNIHNTCVSWKIMKNIYLSLFSKAMLLDYTNGMDIHIEQLLHFYSHNWKTAQLFICKRPRPAPVCHTSRYCFLLCMVDTYRPWPSFQTVHRGFLLFNYGWCWFFITPDNSGIQINIFLVFPQKGMLWVLVRSASPRYI